MSCPACDAAGVPTCSDGLNQPVHVGAILAEMGLLPVDENSVSEADHETIGGQIQNGPDGCANTRRRGLADARSRLDG